MGKTLDHVRAEVARINKEHPGFLKTGAPKATYPRWYDGVRAGELLLVHSQMIKAAYTSDFKKHGREDYWMIDPAGDCEDKAMWVLSELQRRRWADFCMRLCLCNVKRDGKWYGHAVAQVYLTLSDGSKRYVVSDCLRTTPIFREDGKYRMFTYLPILEDKP